MIPYCRTRGIPLVNGTIRRGNLPPRRVGAYRLGLSLSDMAVANSLAGLRAFGGDENGRDRVVYNGFDSARVDALAASGRDFAAHQGTVVVMAARMDLGKDWQLLFSAARALSDLSSDWTFMAIGAGPGREALEGEVADLVERGVVVFADGGTEVLPIIAAADIGVLVTDPVYHAEGCSNAIMEYMACRLPVVCTDSGGNPELVEGGLTGLLVPPGDVNALVTALRALHDDPALGVRLGREGQRRLETRFSVERMVAGFISAYESLLGARRGAQA